MPDSYDKILVKMLAKCDQMLAASEDMLMHSSDQAQRDTGFRAWEAAKDMQEIVEAGIKHVQQIG
jgi:hypothetical protein